MIVFRKKLNAWVVEARDSERQIVTIGNYKTEEEAIAADKEYKDKRLAESYALQQHRIHQQAEAMFERYSRYLEFCVLPKSLTQMREQLDSDKNTAANTIRSLMARGYMKSIVLDDKGKHKKYNFVTIKLISFEEALSYASPKKYKPKAIDEPTIPGARVINFDDSNLTKLYMNQRAIDRANMKSPKNYVSGATMSTSDW
jgi:hypothetical protein